MFIENGTLEYDKDETDTASCDEYFGCLIQNKLYLIQKLYFWQVAANFDRFE